MNDIEATVASQLASRDWRLAGSDASDNECRMFIADVEQVLDQHARRSVTDHRSVDRAVTYAYCPILLAACRDSGSDRQERAFTELHQWIYQRVYARVGNVQDAKDVAQDVLVKVHQNLHRVEKPHGFLGWVSVIIHRELIDYYRRKGRLDQFEQELSWKVGDNGDDDGMDDLAGPDSFLEADVNAAEEELIRMIYECMPKKNRRRADVLVALTLLEQTVTEVAESLEITANAVYLLYFQAKKDLPKHCPELLEFLLQQLTPSQRSSLMEGKS